MQTVLVGCQGNRLTVTSACDLGVVWHVGLCPVHAVIAKAWRSPNRVTHAPDSFISCRHPARSTTAEIRRVFQDSKTSSPPGTTLATTWSKCLGSVVASQSEDQCKGGREMCLLAIGPKQLVQDGISMMEKPRRPSIDS